MIRTWIAELICRVFGHRWDNKIIPLTTGGIIVYFFTDTGVRFTSHGYRCKRCGEFNPLWYGGIEKAPYANIIPVSVKEYLIRSPVRIGNKLPKDS